MISIHVWLLLSLRFGHVFHALDMEKAKKLFIPYIWNVIFIFFFSSFLFGLCENNFYVVMLHKKKTSETKTKKKQ